MSDRASSLTHHHARLLISCPDRSGVIANVTTAIADAGGNVLDADQHADPNTGQFSMRLVFEGDVDREQLEQMLAELDLKFNIRWPGPVPSIAILCSKQTHCLADLLWRASIDELPARITRVISNHTDGQSLTESFGYVYDHLPVTPDTKAEQEARIIELLEQDQTELVILARYMQILSPAIIDRYPGRIINIHHSFLPAFAGAKPYHRAFERGVKIIGATAHYVTKDLDEGPIVAQGTAHVTHRDTVDDMIRKGRDLERVVLANAVRMHLEDRVIVDDQRTIVFE
jgi:formyltetrahydrofolate deformylase